MINHPCCGRRYSVVNPSTLPRGGTGSFLVSILGELRKFHLLYEVEISRVQRRRWEFGQQATEFAETAPENRLQPDALFL